MRVVGLLTIGAVGIAAASSVRYVSGESSKPTTLPAFDPTTPYGLGNPPFAHLAGTSCAAASCHGGEPGTVGGEHTTWAPEVFPDGPSDPHGRAYRVLFNADSQRMGSLLKLPDPPHQNALCLKCHAVDGLSPAGAITEGVGCGACHGPAEAWLTTHYLPGWKTLSHKEKFDRYGFVPTKNLAARVSNCAQCHVGAADREVNHDLIAAGHPRLAFEYARFHYNPSYRKHWVEPTPQPDFEAKAWLIGQAATLRAAVELLRVRADRAAADDPHTPWPEFSGYSCYACHQTIGTGDIRRAVGKADRKPGSLAWELWANGVADVAALQTPAVFPGESPASLPELAALRKMMESTNPKPASVRDQAVKARAELDRWLSTLQAADDRNMRVPSEAPRRIAHSLAADALTPDRKSLRDHDWDFLSVHYLGTAAMYHAAGGAAADAGWRPTVFSLSRLLRFPPPTQRDIDRNDGPVGFGPADRERARDLFRTLAEATTLPGASR